MKTIIFVGAVLALLIVGNESMAQSTDLVRQYNPNSVNPIPAYEHLYKVTVWRKIDLAEKQNINWWMTSALESNIGLNVIAQYSYSKGVSLPQGLGTGGLYSNNIDSPLYIDKGRLNYNPKLTWGRH